jgi:hypothetical protein
MSMCYQLMSQIHGENPVPSGHDTPFGACVTTEMSCLTLEQVTVQVMVELGAEARRDVQEQPATYPDEIEWRERQQRAYLRAAITARSGVSVGQKVSDRKEQLDKRVVRLCAVIYPLSCLLSVCCTGCGIGKPPVMTLEQWQQEDERAQPKP